MVELGAGTGPVTEALLRRLPGVPLIAVELQPALARRLQARFPTVDVRQAAAKEVVDGLIERPGRVVLVSSLPFRSLPREVAAETVDSLCRFLAHDGERKLVQFTYQPRAPFAVPRQLRWHRRAVVWRNTPPVARSRLRQDDVKLDPARRNFPQIIHVQGAGPSARVHLGF